MKKIIFPLALLTNIPVLAQEILPENYIQFSGNQQSGSARFQALGGAMGALGADLSAASINPAGSALFTYNHFSISGNVRSAKANNTFNGNLSKESQTSFNIPSIGAINVIENNKEKGITKTSWGISYQNIHNYNTHTFAKGTSNESGVNYFLNHANHGFNGNPVPHGNVKLQPNETLSGLYEHFNSVPYGFASQQALLAYQGYLINDVGNEGFSSNMTAGTYKQQNKVTTEGYQGKLTFNLAAEVNKKVYIGANFNLHNIKNERLSSFYERNLSSVTTGVKNFKFNNLTYTYGSGFSLQLGAIAKLSESFRIGASYQSPTWMELTDEFQQNLVSVYFDNGVEKEKIIDPNILTVYEPYKFRTPSLWTASASYIFGKVGLISVDYQYKDYSKMTFADKSGAFETLNNYFQKELTASHDLKIGGEFRIKQISLRAGYRNQTNPYKNNQYIGDFTAYSTGLGYSYGKSRLDLSYTLSLQDYKQAPLSSGMSNLENIKFKNHFVNITYSTNF